MTTSTAVPLICALVLGPLVTLVLLRPGPTPARPRPPAPPPTSRPRLGFTASLGYRRQVRLGSCTEALGAGLALTTYLSLFGLAALTMVSSSCAGGTQDELRQRQTDWPEVRYQPGDSSPAFIQTPGRCDRHDPTIPNGSTSPEHKNYPALAEGGGQ